MSGAQNYKTGLKDRKEMFVSVNCYCIFQHKVIPSSIMPNNQLKSYKPKFNLYAVQ